MTFLLVLGTLAIGAGIVALVRLATVPQGKDGAVELGVKDFLRRQAR